MKAGNTILCCVIVQFLIVALCLCMPGCSDGEPAATSGSRKWPSDMPAYVPKLEGDFSHVDEAKSTKLYSKTYRLVFENTTETSDSYEKKLVSKGWKVRESDDFEDMWVMQASYGDDVAWMTAHVEKGKTGTLNFGLVRK